MLTARSERSLRKPQVLSQWQKGGCRVQFLACQGVECGLVVSQGGKCSRPFLTDNLMSILGMVWSESAMSVTFSRGTLRRSQKRSGAGHFMAFALGFGRHGDRHPFFDIQQRDNQTQAIPDGFPS